MTRCKLLNRVKCDPKIILSRGRYEEAREKDGEMCMLLIVNCVSSIPTYTFEYDIIFFLFHIHPHLDPSTYSHDEMKNENNACKVGQSNETTILSAISSTTEGRSEIAVFPSFFRLCSFGCCNIYGLRVGF